MQTANIKTGSQIGLAALFVLMLGAAVFYQERMLLVDAPWVLSFLINSKNFFIQEHRYGSFITQIVPLAGVYLGLSLKALLMLYSVSFNLFYFLSACILYRHKQYLPVLLLALYHTLMVSDCYYWTNNEVHQGITWMCLMLGVWRSNDLSKGKIIHYLLFLCLAFLAVFSHPIVIIAAVFVFGFFILAKRELFQEKPGLISSAILLGMIVVKFIVSHSSWYDGGKISTITSASGSSILDVFYTATAQ